MTDIFTIGDRHIGDSQPAYIIAEVSCNHEGDKQEAEAIIRAAAEAGADAVKLQTLKPELTTRDFSTKPQGTIWEDLNLYELCQKVQTPWEWTKDLVKLANNFGLQMFSTPYDETAVDFLVDEIGVPALKIASFEAVDTKLLAKMASTGLPIIMSNGMTDYLELDEAVRTLRDNGCEELALLHCNSGYPAPFDEANLKTMQAMRELFGCVVGVSDHTLFADHENWQQPMAHVTPVEAVKLGAKMVEVHLTLDRSRAKALFDKGEGGFDWPFSMEPQEFRQMVDMIRAYERDGTISYNSSKEQDMAARTHGTVTFEPTEKEMASRNARPSLWAVKDIKKGEPLTFAAEDKGNGNFDSIRPAGGLHIRFADYIEEKVASRDIKAGEPLEWDMITI